MINFRRFTHASPEQQKAMLDAETAKESRDLLLKQAERAREECDWDREQRMRAAADRYAVDATEPHEANQEEAREWLDRVKGRRPIDLDALTNEARSPNEDEGSSP